MDETLCDCEEDEGTYSIPSDEEWETLFQYQGGLEPLMLLSLFTQNSKVIVHEELIMAKVALESLEVPIFVMNNNLSTRTGSRFVKDLMVRWNLHVYFRHATSVTYTLVNAISLEKLHCKSSCYIP